MGMRIAMAGLSAAAILLASCEENSDRPTGLLDSEDGAGAAGDGDRRDAGPDATGAGGENPGDGRDVGADNPPQDVGEDVQGSEEDVGDVGDEDDAGDVGDAGDAGDVGEGEPPLTCDDVEAAPTVFQTVDVPGTLRALIAGQNGCYAVTDDRVQFYNQDGTTDNDSALRFPQSQGRWNTGPSAILIRNNEHLDVMATFSSTRGFPTGQTGAHNAIAISRDSGPVFAFFGFLDNLAENPSNALTGMTRPASIAAPPANNPNAHIYVSVTNGATEPTPEHLIPGSNGCIEFPSVSWLVQFNFHGFGDPSRVILGNVINANAVAYRQGGDAAGELLVVAAGNVFCQHIQETEHNDQKICIYKQGDEGLEQDGDCTPSLPGLGLNTDIDFDADGRALLSGNLSCRDPLCINRFSDDPIAPTVGLFHNRVLTPISGLGELAYLSSPLFYANGMIAGGTTDFADAALYYIRFEGERSSPEEPLVCASDLVAEGVRNFLPVAMKSYETGETTAFCAGLTNGDRSILTFLQTPAEEPDPAPNGEAEE